jgi:hypothetical protein
LALANRGGPRMSLLIGGAGMIVYGLAKANYSMVVAGVVALLILAWRGK